MRISDWSSDVCSSDLGHFNRGYQSSGTCGPIGAAAAASRLLFSGTERAEQTAKAIGLAAGFSGGVVQYYYSGGSAKRIQPGHAAQSRSEEHTSELQSLMRISYAVFCLKQKKKDK